MRNWIAASPLLFLVVLTACGSEIGEPCELTSGMLGFGFDDPCRTKCLQLSTITCPDGTELRKAICAGSAECAPGSCGSGEACYSFADPFEKRFYCIPEDFCGAAVSEAERLAWETETRERSDAIRAEYAERAKRRNRKPTAEAAPAEPPVAP